MTPLSEPRYISNRLTREHGPFDIIGDIHGCYGELVELIEKLGYEIIEKRPGEALSSGPVYAHPAGRKAIFLGDMVDRGPHILDTLRLVYNMVQHGSALAVIGNHDDKFMRKLMGRNVMVKHGLENTMAELESLPHDVQTEFRQQAHDFLCRLPYQIVLDDEKLVVAHAGVKEEMQGKISPRIKEFALYGETTGGTDEYGLPVRRDWAAHYHGRALVVYGHTPVPEPYWKNNTVGVDTGCIFGGKLSALCYPEREIVSVTAHQVYYQSQKPFPVSVSSG